MSLVKSVIRMFRVYSVVWLRLPLLAMILPCVMFMLSFSGFCASSGSCCSISARKVAGFLMLNSFLAVNAILAANRRAAACFGDDVAAFLAMACTGALRVVLFGLVGNGCLAVKLF